MPTPNTIDIDHLLVPIPGESARGENLRWDAVYEEIKSMREEGGRDMLVDDAVEADWDGVASRCTTALAERSKDLMIAAWLLEALTELHGFAGLRDGAKLIAGLLESFWEVGLYPDGEGDLEITVAPLVWATDADRGARLPNRLREITLFEDPDGEYSYALWKERFPPPKAESEDEEAHAVRKQAAADAERKFEEGAGRASRDTILTLYEDLEEAEEAVNALDRIAGEKFDDVAPGFTAYRTAFEDLRGLVGRLVRDKGGFPEEGEGEGDEDLENGEASGSGGGGGGSGRNGPIQSREDAFRRLMDVAAYLRRTEPQSPIPLLIEKAVAWGRLPFNELLNELVKDDASRSQINDLLGIRPAEEESSSDDW